MKEGRSSKSLAGHLCSKFGISRYRSHQLCNELGFLPTIPFIRLSSENLSLIKLYSDVFFNERNNTLKNIAFKVKLGTTQGIRMRLGRPVRGQRTHTNASTAHKLNKSRVSISSFKF